MDHTTVIKALANLTGVVCILLLIFVAGPLEIEWLAHVSATGLIISIATYITFWALK